MPTLYLIDGNSYIYRAFYAIKGLSTSSGFPTNAIFGFTNMLLKILREKNPDYFAVVFDSPVPSERHKTYEAYKAHRPGMPHELRSQIHPIKEIIAAFKIPYIEVEGYEADDVLATIAKRGEKEGMDIYIITADKDINQVLSSRTKTYDTMREKITEEKDIIERFGIEPSRFPEVMALMGDTSDNIPGVPGIGEKTAVELLKEFGSLDNLIKNHHKIKRPKLRAAISKHIEDIKLSRQLASINTDVPIDVSLESLEPEEPDWMRLLEIFRRFELSSFLKLIPEQCRGRLEHIEYITILDKGALEDVIPLIRNEYAVKILGDECCNGIALAFSQDKAYYIPFYHSYAGMSHQLPKDYVLGRLKEFFEDSEIKKISHDIKQDIIALKNEKINLKGIAFDTMLASYLLNPNKANHSLQEVALTYLGIKKLSLDDITNKGKKDFSKISLEDTTRFLAEEAVLTLNLKNILKTLIEEEGLSGLFYEIEMPLIEVLAGMEITGIKIDLPLMQDLSKELERELNGIERRIYFLAGEKFNINSPKQLQEILFEKLRLKPIKRTKTGFSTDVDVLEQLASEHELPKEILEHRTLSKLKNTYVDALPRLINLKTGRLHTSFNQTVTATGRLSSSEPNLQNIPIRGKWGMCIREAFIAEKGHLLLSSDYSQIELRILAHLSQDEGLIEVFRGGGDIHARTASELFGVSSEDVTADMRRKAKTVNFGIVYGISAYGLSQQLGITPEEAKSYIDAYFTRHRGIQDYMEARINKASATGYAHTLFNRKRAIPELKSTNRNTRQLGERLAINTPIQGSAADIIKIAMINIWKRLKKEALGARMILQVHDELLFEVPIEEKDKVMAIIREEMENAVKLDVPLKVDIGIGKNWAEAH